MTEKENIQDEIIYLESIKPQVNELHDFVTNIATGYNSGIDETPEYYIKMLNVIMLVKRVIDDYQDYMKWKMFRNLSTNN